MDALGKWGKENSHEAFNVAKPLVDKLVADARSEQLDAFLKGLSGGWGRREIQALKQPLPRRPFFRIVVVRHGMGHHNDLHGGLSLFNRDATLNDVGKRQSEAAGAVLAASGYLQQLDLVVVSPFRRTLETAALMMSAAPNKGHTTQTVVHPLAAEHTLLRSAVQQGDRGSTSEELRAAFPAELFPQYDFSQIDSYCAENGLQDGKWWHHNTADDGLLEAVMPHETHQSFEARAAAFRKWLGRECGSVGARNVMVVSHGGLLTEAFG